MPDVMILTEEQLREHVKLDRATVDVIEGAFRALATGRVVMPPILSMKIADHNGEVDVKTAYIPGFDGFAIKVSPGFFDNPKRGLPSLNGLMILFDAKTGLVQALLMDNGYLTDLRTAAAGAVAARHLAPSRVETLGVIGTGVQARLQARAAHLERRFGRALVWGRDKAKAARCAEDIGRALGVDAVAVSSPEDAVHDAQLVITTTPAEEPVFMADWLHPNLHVTAMGSDAPYKNEIEPEVLRRADLFVVDRVSQSRKQGELRAAIEAKVVDVADEPPELGAVIVGAVTGRRTDDEVTVCDLTGTGAQDTAIATHARMVAARAGLGSTISV